MNSIMKKILLPLLSFIILMSCSSEPESRYVDLAVHPEYARIEQAGYFHSWDSRCQVRRPENRVAGVSFCNIHIVIGYISFRFRVVLYGNIPLAVSVLRKYFLII